jgi:hypothetical protein
MKNLNGWISIHDQLPPVSDYNPKLSVILYWCDMTQTGVDEKGLMKNGRPKNRHHWGYFHFGDSEKKILPHFQNGGLGIYQFVQDAEMKKTSIPQALFWRLPELLPEL